VIRFLACAALCAACNPLLHGQAGYVRSMEVDGSGEGAAVELRAGSWNGERSEVGYGGGFALRTKFGDDIQQLATAQEVVVVPFPTLRLFSPYVRGGVHALQLERLGGDLAFGMFSPYGELGLIFALRSTSSDTTFLSVAVSAEYDVRFTGQSPEPFLGLSIGLGGAPYSLGPTTGAPQQTIPGRGTAPTGVPPAPPRPPRGPL
jgi:hypothetical protein